MIDFTSEQQQFAQAVAAFCRRECGTREQRYALTGCGEHSHNQEAGARAKKNIAQGRTATSEVIAARVWREDWSSRVVDDAPDQMRRALDRWRGLRSDALQEIENASKVLQIDSATQQAKAGAKARINEARAALDLLSGDTDSDSMSQSDFYTYRYFASEGFLPGYSFPRLPLAAFIPAQKPPTNGPVDYVQHPRFHALHAF